MKLAAIDATRSRALATLGFQRMMDAIRTDEALFDVLCGLMVNKDASVGARLAGGGLLCIVDCYCAMRGVGMTVTCANPALQPFMDGSKGRIMCEVEQGCGALDQALIQAQLKALCSAVSQVRKQISFSVTVPEAVKAEPLSVRIVGMPERITSQSIERDPGTLEIVSTTNRQVDGGGFLKLDRRQS